MQGLRVHIACLATFAYAVLSDRIVVGIGTGGRGQLKILDIAVPAIVCTCVLLPEPWTLVATFRSRLFIARVFPYLFVTAALSTAGVVALNFPPRTLFGAYAAGVPTLFIVVGVWLSRVRNGLPNIAGRYLLGASVANAAVATAQFLPRFPVFSTNPLIIALEEWDWQQKVQFAGENLIVSRSTGLYLNPNALGFWSVLAFWACWFLLRRSRRYVGMTASLVSLVLSESRGSLIALVASFCVVLAVEALNKARKRRVAALSLFVCGGLLLAFAGLLHSEVYAPSHAESKARLSAIGDVMTVGTDYGGNYDGRLGLWRHAVEFYLTQPMGTLGPPQLKLQQSIDNEYIRVLLQGGIPYMLVFFWLLLAGVRQLRFSNDQALLLGTATIVLAVNSLSMAPVSSPAMALFWLLLGTRAAFQSEAYATANCDNSSRYYFGISPAVHRPLPRTWMAGGRDQCGRKW